MKILGISAHYHDSAAVLIDEGRIVHAVQEERLTRRKFDAAFPVNAINACLQAGQCTLEDIAIIAMHDKPLRKFGRLMSSHFANAPRGFGTFMYAVPPWLTTKLYARRQVRDGLAHVDGGGSKRPEIVFAAHHQSHAASAFYPSPFDDALVLTIDGVGEQATTSVFRGNGSTLTLVKQINFPDSLGLLYAAITQYLGFKVLSGEYKVMGLAPYGTPKYTDLILGNLIMLHDDGSFQLDQTYFDYVVDKRMFSDEMSRLFGQPPRAPEAPLTQFHMDLAASIQAVIETAVLGLCRALVRDYPEKNLCLAGGVALNCVANGRIVQEGLFENLWVQPAAGDAGCALGAALAVWHQKLDQPRPSPKGHDSMRGAYLGASFTQKQIEARLDAIGAVYSVGTEADMLNTTAQSIADGQAVGWFQGAMEFGPRALGARSILADPRSTTMQRTLNLKVKFRESFRPFAPAVLAEKAAEWFDLKGNSPYMLLTTQVARAHHKDTDHDLDGLAALAQVRSDIPAVTHVNRSARVQTVSSETNPLFHKLLSRFDALTGCPVLVNTSFNVRGEPIVCSPEDAFACFMDTGIEMLVIGRCILQKTDQPKDLLQGAKREFALD